MSLELIKAVARRAFTAGKYDFLSAAARTEEAAFEEWWAKFLESQAARTLLAAIEDPVVASKA